MTRIGMIRFNIARSCEAASDFLHPHWLTNRLVWTSSCLKRSYAWLEGLDCLPKASTESLIFFLDTVQNGSLGKVFRARGIVPACPASHLEGEVECERF